MIRKGVLFLILLITFLPLAFAKTVTLQNCNQNTVQDAVNSAADGDTINIPPGSCTWATPVSWNNKNIALTGSGMDSTVITSTGGTIFQISNEIKSGFRISGMTLKGVSSDGRVIFIDASAGTKPSKGWRIDHIHFDFRTGQSDGAMVAYIAGMTWGLVDHIIYDGGGYGAIVLAGYSANDGWPPAYPGQGSPYWNLQLNLPINDEAVYIEDSTWNIAPGHYISAVNDMYYGGRMVFRYNRVTNAYYQSHAARTNDRGGNIWSEVYNNEFHATDSNWVRAIHLRGGTGVIYNNALLDSYTSIHVDDQRSCGAATGAPYGSCDGTKAYDGNTPGGSGYPCLDQIGRSPGPLGNQPLYPLYGWNNGFSVGCATGGQCGGNALITVNGACDSSEHIKEGRDFVNNGATPKLGYISYVYPHPLQGGVLQKTCGGLGGSCCSSGQTCSGTTQTASDCVTCCTGTCKSQQTCIAGDLNCDKKVDIFDLVLVAQNYGKTSGFDTKADANKDGRVDIFDLVVVAQNYGKTG